MSKQDFDRLMLEAVDESLSSLGDSAKQTIYFHLRKIYNIKKKEIPNKLEEFDAAMEETFGLGCKFLEIRIMRHLYEKVGKMFKYKPKRQDLVFPEYINSARRSFFRNKPKVELEFH